MAGPPALAISPESMPGESRPIYEPPPDGEGLHLAAPDSRSPQASCPSAHRLENPRHSPTLRQLEKAAAALGKRLVLALE